MWVIFWVCDMTQSYMSHTQKMRHMTQSYVWCDGKSQYQSFFGCLIWLNHMCHSHVYDSIIYVTWYESHHTYDCVMWHIFWVYDMTQSYMSHNSISCVTAAALARALSLQSEEIVVSTQFFFVSAIKINLSIDLCVYICICVYISLSLGHIFDVFSHHDHFFLRLMTQSYVWLDEVTCETPAVLAHNLALSGAIVELCHFFFPRVIWLSHMCDLTASLMRHLLRWHAV